MSEYKYGSLKEGLDELVKRMKKDMPKWNAELSQAYYTMREAAAFLKETIRTSGPKHFAWHNYMINPNNIQHNFNALHWMLSYKQLSEHFDVPMTWLHTLKMKAVIDPIRQTWIVKAYKILDGDGYLLETAYGAYCDGVDLGLIPEDEMSIIQRQPDMIEMAEDIDKQFKKYAKDHDMTVEEATFSLTLEHDMTVA